MENSIKEKKSIEKKDIEKIFDKLNLKYEIANYEDDDLNYFIQVDGSNILTGTGMLEALMYFSTNYPKCTVMIGNVYRFKEDNKSNALEIANKINAKLNSGKVVVFEKPKQLIYIDSRVCGSFSEIDEEFIDIIIKSLYISLAIIYNDIKAIGNEK